MTNEIFQDVYYIGRDGFYHWIGQIETLRGTQPKGYDNQYKVRIIGQHLKDCTKLTPDDLPWAQVITPVSMTRNNLATNYHSLQLTQGDWVVGYFLDGAKGQQPVILGTIGPGKNTTDELLKIINPKEDGQCRGFENYYNLSNVFHYASLPSTDITATRTPTLGPPLNTNYGDASSVVLATKGCNTDINPFGQYFCVLISDAKCFSGESFQTTIQQILTELFANIPNNSGSFKNGILSPFTGQIYDFVAIAQGYINKINTLISSSLTRVKGEIYALIKQGTNEILDFLLTDKAVDTDATNEQQKILAGLRSSQISNNLNAVAKSTINTISFAGSSLFPSDSTISTNSSFTDATSFVLADGTSFGPPPVMKKVGRLAPLTQWINQQLEQVGCKMEDLDKRLRDYLTNKIFAYINKAFTAATCMIDGIVQDIINDINSFLDSALKDILGPLQQLLDVSGSSTNILGTALQKIFDLLGITCGNPTSSCISPEQKHNCTGPCGSQTNTNFLDNLIASVEQGNLTSPSDSCSDIYQVPSAANTVISVIGGAPDSTAFTGSTTNIVASTPTDPISDAINTLFPIIPLTPIIVSPPVTLLNVKYAGKSNLSITNYATTSSFIVFSIAL